MEVSVGGALGMVSELRIEALPSRSVVVEDDRTCETPDLMRNRMREAGVDCLVDLFPDTRSWANTNLWGWTTPYAYGCDIQSTIMAVAEFRDCAAPRHGNEKYR